MMTEIFEDRRVLVTGAAGTIGKYLAKKLTNYPLKELILFDNNESEVFFLYRTFQKNKIPVTVYLGDITDRDKLRKITKGVDIIFHCAAYKHVLLSEYNSYDYVRTNVWGVQNVIECALENGVRIVINTETSEQLSSLVYDKSPLDKLS